LLAERSRGEGVRAGGGQRRADAVGIDRRRERHRAAERRGEAREEVGVRRDERELQALAARDRARERGCVAVDHVLRADDVVEERLRRTLHRRRRSRSRTCLKVAAVTFSPFEKRRPRRIWNEYVRPSG
jgi:hypothetical protein